MRIKTQARQALPHPRPGEYLTFAGLMLTTFCGVTSASRALAKPLGYLLLGAFVLALCRQVWRLAGRREFSAAEVITGMFLGFRSTRTRPART